MIPPSLITMNSVLPPLPGNLLDGLKGSFDIGRRVGRRDTSVAMEDVDPLLEHRQLENLLSEFEVADLGIPDLLGGIYPLGLLPDEMNTQERAGDAQVIAVSRASDLEALAGEDPLNLLAGEDGQPAHSGVDSIGLLDEIPEKDQAGGHDRRMAGESPAVELH